MISIRTNAKYAGKIHSLYITANQEDALQSGKCNVYPVKVQIENYRCWLSLQQSRTTGRNRKGDEVFPRAKSWSKKALAGISLITNDDLKYYSSPHICKWVLRSKTSTGSLCPGLLSTPVSLPPSSPTCGEACGHFLPFAVSPAKCAEPSFLSWEMSLSKTAVTNNQRSLATSPDYILPYLSAASTHEPARAAPVCCAPTLAWAVC